jgi:hypothetical protein
MKIIGQKLENLKGWLPASRLEKNDMGQITVTEDLERLLW